MSNNEPAFPCDYDMSTFVNAKQGMTLRDYFAAKAMQAMVGSYRKTLRGLEDAQHDSDADLTAPDRLMMLDCNTMTGACERAAEIAGDAYAIADAMLRERAKEAK